MPVTRTIQVVGTQYSSFEALITVNNFLDKLVRSNIVLSYISGDSIEDITYTVRGTWKTYYVTVELPPNKKGSFSMMLIGDIVIYSRDIDTISSPPVTVNYNTHETIEPEVEKVDMPSQLIQGEVDILIDFNVEISGLSADSFLFTG